MLFLEYQEFKYKKYENTIQDNLKFLLTSVTRRRYIKTILYFFDFQNITFTYY